jgi:hypothetical protein
MSLDLSSLPKPVNYGGCRFSSRQSLFNIEQVPLLPLMSGLSQWVRQHLLPSVRLILINFWLLPNRIDQKISDRHEGVMGGVDRILRFAVPKNVYGGQQT